MIALRPMLPHEFAAYLDYFIPDYAAEISTNFSLARPDAVLRATAEVAADLPQGTATAGQVLMCVVERSDSAGQVDPAEPVLGYFWYKPDKVAGSVFINDFYVFPEHQGKGLGKQALAVLQAHLAGEGFKEIRLRVAAHNDRARHVYETTGFQVTGYNMSKSIPAAE